MDEIGISGGGITGGGISGGGDRNKWWRWRWRWRKIEKLQKNRKIEEIQEWWLKKRRM